MSVLILIFCFLKKKNKNHFYPSRQQQQPLTTTANIRQIEQCDKSGSRNGRLSHSRSLQKPTNKHSFNMIMACLLDIYPGIKHSGRVVCFSFFFFFISLLFFCCCFWSRSSFFARLCDSLISFPFGSLTLSLSRARYPRSCVVAHTVSSLIPHSAFKRKSIIHFPH